MECIFDGCEKPNFARGYCAGHAAQIRRGKPLAPLGRIRPTSPEGQSWCSRCKQHKSVDNFSWDWARDEPERICHACRAAAQREYSAKNREKTRLGVTLGQWKLTEEKYLELFEAQGHKCAICGAKRREYRRLSIDHDHKTGLIRGLLCQDCNLGMGQLNDDPDILQRAVDYLRNGGVIHDPNLRIPETSYHFRRSQQRDAARARRREEQSAE